MCTMTVALFTPSVNPFAVAMLTAAFTASGHVAIVDEAAQAGSVRYRAPASAAASAAFCSVRRSSRFWPTSNTNAAIAMIANNPPTKSGNTWPRCSPKRSVIDDKGRRSRDVDWGDGYDRDECFEVIANQDCHPVVTSVVPRLVRGTAWVGGLAPPD